MKPDLRIPFDANAANPEENGAGRGAYSTYSFRPLFTIQPVNLRSIGKQFAAVVTFLGISRRGEEHRRENSQREHDMQGVFTGIAGRLTLAACHFTWRAASGGTHLIDLHSHLLPGIDDGAADEEQSLEMARMAVADGITVQACTPHIFPGVYNNAGPDIRARVAHLQFRLHEAGVPLRLVVGADIHMTPNLVAKLRSGEALTLNDTRYLLIETPHHVLPPRTEDVFFDLRAAGFVPILTHPERMSWIDHRYEFVKRLVEAGVWMQLTAGALTGHFGNRPQYWSQRMLDDGLVHIMATDAHDTSQRPPRLSAAFEVLVARIGESEAKQLVLTRPEGILDNRLPSELVVGWTRPSVAAPAVTTTKWWQRLGSFLGGQ
ncbi:MAG TPA: CpsB/CapC family capsule biosynthesis tyrosine phosphatase [Gemmatimonadales bacterium]|nr:CpsB/CapC family capsule biosynthesis tyrosine phosphatase [Gemmatimonadales bacterium]